MKSFIILVTVLAAAHASNSYGSAPSYSAPKVILIKTYPSAGDRYFPRPSKSYPAMSSYSAAPAMSSYSAQEMSSYSAPAMSSYSAPAMSSYSAAPAMSSYSAAPAMSSYSSGPLTPSDYSDLGSSYPSRTVTHKLVPADPKVVILEVPTYEPQSSYGSGSSSYGSDSSYGGQSYAPKTKKIVKLIPQSRLVKIIVEEPTIALPNPKQSYGSSDSSSYGEAEMSYAPAHESSNSYGSSSGSYDAAPEPTIVLSADSYGSSDSDEYKKKK